LAKAPPASVKKPVLPEKSAVLAFRRDNPQAGEKDIAKAFGLKGAARFQLANMLQELQEEASLPAKQASRRTAKTAKKAALPPICVLEIVARDKDGLLLARPLAADTAKSANKKGRERPRPAIEPANSIMIAVLPGTRAPAAGIGSRVLVKIFPAKDEDKKTAPYQGRIIRILAAQPAAILAIVRQNGQNQFYLEPTDRKQAELQLDPQAAATVHSGDLVLAEPQGGKYGAQARFGIIKQHLGSAALDKALSSIALYSHNIPAEFPPEVLAEAQKATRQKLPGKRQDWRHIPFITIDPASAKDHDDAVFAKADMDSSNKGGHILLIAIADVAAYVLPDSAMDKEARRRGNSVYFPDRVVPMLPEEISNNLCSLRAGEDRPALAAEITISAKGRIIRHKFHRVLIQSRAGLSYEQAQAAIDGREVRETAPLLQPVLRPLWAAWRSLQQARYIRQPLELDLPERKIILDENGHIADIRLIARLDAHRLIEEFMIAANIAAAEVLQMQNRPLLFRIHDSPSPARQESLREFLRIIGIKLGSGAAVTPEKFNHILAQAAGRDYQALVNQLVLRSQAQAEYSLANIGHFGLRLRHYAHFTSPIRRYADLLLHRSLITALHLGKDGISAAQEAELAEIAVEISATERRATLAERDTNDRLLAHYLSNHIGAQFSGRINGVTRAGLFITLDKTGADGLVSLASLKAGSEQGEYYHFDEAHFAFIGERSGKGFQLGDNVEVRLLAVQKAAGSLRFAMLSPPKKLPFAGKSFHKAAHRRKPPRAPARKPR